MIMITITSAAASAAVIVILSKFVWWDTLLFLLYGGFLENFLYIIDDDYWFNLFSVRFGLFLIINNSDDISQDVNWELINDLIGGLVSDGNNTGVWVGLNNDWFSEGICDQIFGLLNIGFANFTNTWLFFLGEINDNFELWLVTWELLSINEWDEWGWVLWEWSILFWEFSNNGSDINSAWVFLLNNFENLFLGGGILNSINDGDESSSEVIRAFSGSIILKSFSSGISGSLGFISSIGCILSSNSGGSSIWNGGNNWGLFGGSESLSSSWGFSWGSWGLSSGGSWGLGWGSWGLFVLSHILLWGHWINLSLQLNEVLASSKDLS